MGSKSVNAGVEAREGTAAQAHRALFIGYLGEEPHELYPSADGLASHGLVEALSLCCYARAAEAHIDWMLHRTQSAIESLFRGLSAEGSLR